MIRVSFISRVVFLLALIALVPPTTSTVFRFIPTLAVIRALRKIKEGVDVSEYGVFDPDVDLSTPDMIRKEGYPAEAHIIATNDGYLLTLHRIPGNNDSQPVLLQHGLLGSSADWVIAGKYKALAYLLADQGYDVWLGNFRGNTYSKAHIYLPTTDPKFWDFSWHEMAIHDLPAMISYITNLRGSKLWYAGHSMGTTTSYIMASRRQDITDRINAMFSLAPVAFMSRVKSPVRLLAPFADDLRFISHILGEDEFFPQNELVRILAKYGCELCTMEKAICSNMMFVIAGFDRAQFNRTLLPVILTHSPAGASTKTFVHYAQEILSGRFCEFDYGMKKNLILYNDTKPPEYDLSKIRVPIALYYSDNDWFANVLDVHELASRLNRKLDVYEVPYSKFNHLDFLWGIDVSNLVYQRMILTMSKNGGMPLRRFLQR